MTINITKEEAKIIWLLLKIERSNVRFFTGFGKPSEKELKKEEFLDKLLKKFE